jgi:hypothetical protein
MIDEMKGKNEPNCFANVVEFPPKHALVNAYFRFSWIAIPCVGVAVVHKSRNSTSGRASAFR